MVKRPDFSSDQGGQTPRQRTSRFRTSSSRRASRGESGLASSRSEHSPEGPRYTRNAFTSAHGRARQSTRCAGPPLRSGPPGDRRARPCGKSLRASRKGWPSLNCPDSRRRGAAPLSRRTAPTDPRRTTNRAGYGVVRCRRSASSAAASASRTYKSDRLRNRPRDDRPPGWTPLRGPGRINAASLSGPVPTSLSRRTATQPATAPGFFPHRPAEGSPPVTRYAGRTVPTLPDQVPTLRRGPRLSQRPADAGHLPRRSRAARRQSAGGPPPPRSLPVRGLLGRQRRVQTAHRLPGAPARPEAAQLAHHPLGRRAAAAALRPAPEAHARRAPAAPATEALNGPAVGGLRLVPRRPSGLAETPRGRPAQGAGTALRRRAAAVPAWLFGPRSAAFFSPFCQLRSDRRWLLALQPSPVRRHPAESANTSVGLDSRAWAVQGFQRHINPMPESQRSPACPSSSPSGRPLNTRPTLFGGGNRRNPFRFAGSGLL